MRCWKCSGELDGLKQNVGFRAECPHCAAWVHCCRACEFYNPLVAQSCEIPNIDYVGDKEVRNLCESFRLAPDLTADAAASNHDGRQSSEDARKRFEDLFS